MVRHSGQPRCNIRREAPGLVKALEIWVDFLGLEGARSMQRPVGPRVLNRVRRRGALGGTAAAILLPALAWAQGAGKIARIGVLVTGSKPHPIAQALPRELATLGYREGTQLVFDVRYADRSNDRARVLARELVELKCDVIVTHFSPATR